MEKKSELAGRPGTVAGKLQHDLKEKWIGQIIEEMMQYYGVTLSKYDEQQYLEVQRLIRIGCNEFLATLRRQGADIEIIH